MAVHVERRFEARSRFDASLWRGDAADRMAEGSDAVPIDAALESLDPCSPASNRCKQSSTKRRSAARSSIVRTIVALAACAASAVASFGPLA